MKRLSREVYGYYTMKIGNLKAEQTGQLIWENASMHRQWKQTGFSSPILIQKHLPYIFCRVVYIGSHDGVFQGIQISTGELAFHYQSDTRFVGSCALYKKYVAFGGSNCLSSHISV